MGHDFIGTEHMLLGLLSVGEGPAYDTLSDLDVTADRARALVSERVHASEDGNVESPPFTPLAKQALSWALREALDMKAAVIGSQHLLLGLIDVPDGGGAQILEELAGSLLFVRHAVVAREPRGSTGESGAGAAEGGGATPEVAGEPGAEESEGPEAGVTLAAGPLSGRYLRRWAAQTRTMLRPPAGPGRSPVRMAHPLGQAPRCPTCQASLEIEARFLRLAVAGGAEGQGGSEAEGIGGRGEGESEGKGEGGEGPDGEGEVSAGGRDTPDDSRSSVTVTVVYCRRCGVALGTV